MPARLQCPACSAPLDVPGVRADTLRCPYCGTAVLLTERPGGVEATAGAGHPETVAEVVRLLRAGRKVDAVKLYRERFGVGLKEAKEAVERIAAGQPPGTLPAPARAGAAFGCAGAVLALAVGAGVLAAVLGSDGPAHSDPPPVAAPVAAPPVPAEPAPPPGFAEPVLEFGEEGVG
ncbi:MAG TPA: hypothetical protein VHG51_00315, partial [Longimicrobiaceae bacterium]|nr:hypothetical protein [Longimicrobiaceae bacterium]